MNKIDYYRKKLEALSDKELRIFERPSLIKNPKKFHIVGICGTAMGALAGLLREKGFSVSGSDQVCYPPISTMLDGLDVQTHIGNFEAKNIGDADIIVIGNVARPLNPEAKFARENNLVQATLPEVLREYIFEDALRIVVSGTHGKTTTTGIVTSIFESACAHPGFMIGGVPQGKEHGYALGSGEFAIFEGDEYDTSYFNKMPKFLQYGAHTGIVTALELDHLDIYSDLNDYRKAFEFFVSEIPKEGFLFLNGDKEETKSLEVYSKANVFTYGLSDNNDIYAKDLKTENGVQKFNLIYNGANLGEIETSLSGTHNIANIVASAGVALAHGLSFQSIKDGVKIFEGMKRRQEIVADTNGILLIDDFAHHPTAVRETLFGIKKKYEGRRIVALFEPRSNSSRKKIFEKDYIESFDNADLVFIKVPPFREGDVPEDFMDANFVAEEVTKRGTEMSVAENVDKLIENSWSKIKEGDVVIMMSNGSFDGLKERLLDKLNQKA